VKKYDGIEHASLKIAFKVIGNCGGESTHVIWQKVTKSAKALARQRASQKPKRMPGVSTDALN